MSVKIDIIREYENFKVANLNIGFYKKNLRNLGVDPKTFINK